MAERRDSVLWTFFVVAAIFAALTNSQVQHKKLNRYVYKVDRFTRCSLSCGGGIQTAIFICYDNTKESAVDPSRCRDLQHPGTHRRVCNVTPCKHRWYTSPWRPCSKTCGTGVQHRFRRCVNRHNRRISLWKCARLTPPRRKRACAIVDCPVEWNIGPWSKCSVSCGEGIRRRSIACRQTLANATIIILPVSKCPGIPPAIMVKCKDSDCDSQPTDTPYAFSGAGQSYDIQGDEPIDQEPDLPASDASAAGPSGDGSIKDRPTIILSKKKEYLLKKTSRISVLVGSSVWSVKGSEITVKCRTPDEDKAMIQWFTEGGFYEIKRFQRYEDDVGIDDEGNLHIRSVGRFNEGTYQCKATRLAGASSTAAFTLKILALNTPTILSAKGKASFGPRDADVTITVGTTVTLYKGTTLTIKCPVMGKPTPTVYWYSQGRPIAVGKAVTIGNNLRIENIDKIYALEYTCHAYNRRARTKESSVVNVLDLAPPIIAAERKVISVDKTTPSMDITIGTNLTVMAGTDVVVRCPVKTRPEPGLSWRIRGLAFDPKTSRAKLQNDNSTLLLSGLTKDDAGSYTCIARNNAGKDQKVTNIQVADPQKPTIISQSGFKSSHESDIEMTVTIGIQTTVLSGITLTIICPTRGLPAPDVTWEMNNTNVRPGGRFVVQEGTLTIRNLVKQDQGNIRCVARNAAGQDTATSKLNVIDGRKPKINALTGRVIEDGDGEEARITIGQDLRVVEKMNVRIHCPIVGFPKPVVTWTRNNQDVRSNARLFVDPNTNDLLINNILTSDTGQYICSAVNPIGEDEKSSFISIISEASAEIIRGNASLVTSSNRKPVTVVIGNSLEVLSGTDVTIVCPVRGTPSPFIFWRHDGLRIASGQGKGQFLLGKDNSGRDILIIAQVTKDVSGSYECVASNVGGADRVATSIQVIEAQQPVIEFISKRLQSLKDLSAVTATIGTTITLLAGAKLVLQCPSTGVPLPSTSWSLNGEPLEKSGRADLRGTELVIPAVAGVDSGKYQCTASNVIALDSRASDVTVRDPTKPKIRGAPKDMDLFEIMKLSVDVGSTITTIPGVSLELKCSAQGLPAPTIRWRLGEIVVDSDTLKLPQLKVGDSRTYTCVASNVAGNDSKSTVLNIKAIEDPVIHAEKATIRAVDKVTSLTSSIGNAITVLKGSRVTLVCHATGFPQPIVQWTRNKVDLTGRMRQLRYNVTHYGVIIDTRFNGELSGEYACLATNKGGFAAVTTDLQIKAPFKPFIRSTWVTGSVGTHKSLKSRDPVIVTIGDKVETLTGTEVSIICPVEGLPPPKVTWAKNGPIASGDKFTIARSTDLVFNSGKASVFDSGRYSCRAVNNLGQDTAYSEVTFREPKAPTIMTLDDKFEFIVNATFTVTIGANVSALRGSSITLTCTAEGLPVPFVVWKKGGATLQQGGRAFTLSSTESADSGRYDCVATNLKGTAIASSAVTIHDKIEKRVAPKILSSKKNLIASENKRLFYHIIGGNITILEGKDLELQCPSIGTPKPAVTWFINGSAVTESDTLKVDPNTGALSIIEITAEEQGQYMCKSKNIAGEDLETSYTTVVGPVAPKIQLSNKVYSVVDPLKKPLTLLVGDTLTTLSGTRTSISCPATGFPNPLIRWSRNGESVVPGGHLKIDGSKLLLTNPQKEDNGVYKCLASNPGGDATATSNMTFIDPSNPNITLSRDVVKSTIREAVSVIIGSDVTVIDGSTILIQCSAVGVPKPTLSWIRNGVNLSNSEEVLKLSNLRVGGDGSIKCVASNFYGTDSAETTLTILAGARPRIILSRNVIKELSTFKTKKAHIGDYISLLAGSSLIIQCNATGIPSPTYSWLRNSAALTSGGQVTVNESTGELSLLGLRAADSGRYTCQASNLEGSDGASSSLLVREPRGPFIESSSQSLSSINSTDPVRALIGSNLTVLAGASVTLVCSATGLPMPVTSWKHNSGDITSGHVTIQGSALRITKTSNADSGVYACLARSPAGEVTVTSHLILIAGSIPVITRSADVIEDQSKFSNLTVTIGTKVTLLASSSIKITCKAIGIPKPVVTWTMRGRPVVPSDRVMVEKNALVFLKILATDTGNVVCTANNARGSDVASSLITVLDTYGPKISTVETVITQLDHQNPVTSKVGASVTALSGVTVTFVCQAIGLPVPTITWTFNGKPLTSHGQVTVTNQSVTIIKARSEDSGDYVCNATSANGQGSARSVIKIEAGAKPRITSIGKVVSLLSSITNITANIGDNITLLAGSTLKLRCPSDGLPKPFVKWTRYGVRAMSNERQLIDSDSDTLTMVEVLPYDSGEVSCTVTNLRGSDKKTSSITVLEPFAPSIDTSDETVVSLSNLDPVTVRAGALLTTFLTTNITLVCKARGLPKPSVSWTRAGDKLSHWLASMGRVSTSNGNVTITQAEPNDAGMYLCTARNLLGVASARSTLYFKEPRGPFIVTQKKSLTIFNATRPIDMTIGTNLTTLVNTTITIRCQASGDPAPDTAWQRPGNKPFPKHVTIDREDLTIDMARESDQGFYVCVASSDLRRVTETTYITFLAGLPPKITRSQEVISSLTRFTNLTVTIGSTISVLAGSRLKLLCPVTGIPRPAVSWSIDGSDVTPNEGVKLGMSPNSLEIPRLVSRDSGSFTCEATNRIGADQASSWVSVMEPFGPKINSTRSVIIQLDSQAPITTMAGATLTTISGVDLTINCQATGLPVPDVAWFLEGERVISQGGISVENGKLRIRNAGNADGGRYVCTANSSVGEDSATTVIAIQGSEKARITSVGDTKSALDDISSYTFTIGDNITILAGSALTINCPTEGLPRPSVTWSVTRTQAPGVEGLQAVPIVTSRLTVAKLQLSDSGVYTCTARNLKGNDTMTSVVTVFAPYGPNIETSNVPVEALKNLEPVSVLIGANLTAFEKAPVTLTCKATGLPLPMVRWTKGGRQLVSKGHEIVAGGRLFLGKATLGDSGEYECTATSPLGYVSAKSNLEIKAPIPPSIKTSDEIIESLKRDPLGLVIGQTARTLTRIIFNITCETEGLPAPNITWKKNGVALPVDGRMYARGHILFIAESLTRDSGVYICEATNIAGSKQAKSELKVIAPVEPVITATVQRLEELRPVSITTEVGSYIRTLETSNLTLVCTVRGFPLPVISWRRGGQAISNTQSALRYRIENARVKDTGIYTCVARNLVGYDYSSSNISIVAAKPPIIRTSTHHLTVLRRDKISTDLGKNVTTLSGNTVSLLCNATGVPSPKLSWYKDGETLNVSHAVLTLPTLSPSDSGLYRCEARNLKGVDDADSYLTVLVGSPPSIRTTSENITETENIAYIVTGIGSDVITLLSSNVEVTCPVRGFPLPSITWLKDGQPLKQSMTVKVNNLTGTLYLLSILERRAGLYMCVATNSLGAATATTTLNVLPLSFPRVKISRGVVTSIKSRDPAAIDIGQDLTVLSDTNITITCPATGRPVPVVSWKRGKRLLQTGDRLTITGMNLTITMVTREDGGRYECFVQNVMGELSAGSNLKVLDPVKPRIHADTEILKIFRNQPIRTSIGSSVTTIPGNAFALTCNATGLPVPDLTWERDNLQIQRGGAEFIIPSINVSDTGDYACVATNLVGVAKVMSRVHSLVGDIPRIQSNRQNVVATGGENEVVVEIGGNLTTIVGTGVEITCPMTGEPVPMVTWLKDGVMVEITSVVYMNKETKALVILGITMDDVGRYTCYANNSFGVDQESTLIRVIAARSPNIRFTKRRLEDYDSLSHALTIGDNLNTLISTSVSIHCNATGNPVPSITWSRSGALIEPSKRIKIMGSTLVIVGTLWSDTGSYECVASNGAGTDRKSSFLKFVPPETPVIEVSSEVLEVYDRTPVSMRIGAILKTLTLTPVSINCSATGIPTPSYSWLRRGQLITPGEGFDISADGKSLTVQEVTMDDAGMYECNAVNRAGTNTANSPIIAQEPILPRITFTDENVTWYDRLPLNVAIGGKITALTGTKIVLSCQASGFPHPRVTWRRDDNPDELDPDGQYDLSNQTLVIFSVQPSDTGVYRCIASNIAGDVHGSTSLIVIDPKDPVIAAMDVIIRTEDRKPVSTTIGSRVTVLQGTSVSIKCPVHGIPAPAITWSNGGRFLPVSNGNSTLVLSNTRVSDTGEYMCTAMSPIGADAASTLLTVLAPQKPSISGPVVGRVIPLTKTKAVSVNIRDSVTAFLGSTLRIRCSANGLPAPEVKWSKDGQRVVKDVDENGTLSIVLRRTTDAGRYVCTAVNAIGSDEAETFVYVVEPNYPRIVAKKGLATAPDGRRPIAGQIGMTIRTLTSTSITLKCPVTGSPKPLVDWSKTGQPIISGDRVSVTVTGSLVIVNSRSSDSGEYVCTARNLLGEDSAVSTVNILIPTIPVIHKSTNYIVWYENRPFKTKIGNNLTTMKGRKLTLICHATGRPRPTITWFRGGEEMRTKGNVVVDGDKLIVSDLSLFDTDRYTCVATNVAGGADATTTLKVHDPVRPGIFASYGHINALPGFSPVNVTAGQDVSVPADTSTVISCPIKGVPRPKIIWLRENEVVYPDDVIELGCNGSLRFHGIRTRDSAEYACYVESYLGMDMAFTSVNVVPRSVPIISKSNQTLLPKDNRPVTAVIGDNVTTFVGNSITIKCHATGIPYPTLRWTRNGVKLPSVGMYLIDNSGSLTIRGATEGGVYTCVAANDQGQDRATSILDVIEPRKPKILAPSPLTIPLSGTPRVTIVISDNVTVLEDSTIRIVCNATGLPAPRVTWRQNGNAISQGGRYRVTADGVTMLIDGAVVSDTGSFTCEAENFAGKDKATSAVIVKIPAKPSIERTNKPRPISPEDGSPITITIGDNITALTNTQVTFRCNATGTPMPSVIWTKDGQVLVSGPRHVINKDGSIVIQKASPVDRGRYTCTARNSHGEDRVSSTLNTMDPVVPKILSPDDPRTIHPDHRSRVHGTIGDNITALTDTLVTLHCPVTGVPAPTITWSRNGQEMPANGDGYLVTNNGSLILEKVSSSDIGRYTCTARNAFGKDNANSTVNVMDPVSPEIVRSDEPRTIPPGDGSPLTATVGDNITALTNTQVTLRCQATGTPMPSVIWSKDGQVLVSGPRHVINKNGSIVIQKASPVDRGRYTCTARNSHGEDRVLSTLNTMDPTPPRIKQTNQTKTIPPGDGSPVKVSVGDNITVITDTPLLIDCEVSGIPFPSVVWVKDGRVLMGEGYVIFDNGTLVLRRARPADSGRYTCTANNSRGKDHISSQVKVIEPSKPTIERPVAPRDIPLGDGSPTIARIADNATVLTGSRLTIDCVATGVPKPSIIWRKDGRELIGAGSYMAPGNGSLLIQQVAASHHGVFTCTATNPVGEDSVSSNIRVVDPVLPRISRPTIGSTKSTDNMNPVSISVGSDVTAIEGVTVSIECNATGVPRPEVFWSKDGLRLYPGEYPVLENKTLIITNAKVDDSGYYTCTAQSSIGKDSQSSVVEILPAEVPIIQRTTDKVEKSDMKPVDVRIGGQVTSLSGVDITLNCSARGLPPPDIEWMNGGKMITVQGPRLVLRNVMSSDSGNYTCIASNVVGRASASTMVNVTDPIMPSI
ncbi:hemicentin-2 isoform X2 [Nematostella vectensis]|nr:hemicentin-2 isoform X2 [Nematostella vectensis]